ncbi:alpha beta-hydrolase [Suillus hirtellus]|nr:alpha beta-hydrolase [Suillus hirtellus]
MATPVDYGNLEFTRPAKQIKAVNLPAVPQRIFDGMKQYEDAARGFSASGFERTTKDANGKEVPGGIIVAHRPADAQVTQLYRMPTDPSSTELSRLTYFDIGSGRTISAFRGILEDDWRGVRRRGGAIMAMDLNGNEHFQLWRYWEDSLADQVLPKVQGELDNAPGLGRIERLTHDDYRYGSIVISQANNFMAFASNKENNKDTLVYVTRLTDSNTGAKADASPFTLPSRLVAPSTGEGTTMYSPRSFSLDDKYLLITRQYGSSYNALYVVDISGEQASPPKLIEFPGATEKPEDTAFGDVAFSHNVNLPHLIYCTTNGYGDFTSVVAYDLDTASVTHITTSGVAIQAIRPILWEIEDLKVTSDNIVFTVNVEGWTSLFFMPLSGSYKNTVIEVKVTWERGWLTFQTNDLNDKSYELTLHLTSYHSRGRITYLNLLPLLKDVKKDENGNAYVVASGLPYAQAAPPTVAHEVPPTLIRYKSFDNLEVPAIYYHPVGQSVTPVIIHIHGGPESQATANYRTPTHSYLLNELKIAVIYPNVRGSSGYGKKYMAADDVLKREDSVKDIGALLEHIASNMQNELDSSRIAVAGGSYGGYMSLATLTHYSSKLVCGIENFGIVHWPSFLENTADVRRAARRREYGDETIPEIREFLDRISPINNTSKITVPLLITHGENDTRVTVHEAVSMYKTVSKNVHTELVICEMEGHGYKQKSVIEFTNAADILFLERYLLAQSNL